MARKNQDIDKIDKHIGKKIFELRLSKGYSRQELGQKIGVTHQQCQKYEKGTNRISAGRLLLVADVLGQPVSYFYDGMDPEENVELNVDNQRMCIEVSRNFMRIKDETHKDAINALVRSLVQQAS